MSHEAESLKPYRLEPGATIGMLGGGQLGRMFALAAQPLGFRVAVLAEEAAGPAGQVANQTIVGDYSTENLDRLAQASGAVTLEFENIPDAAVRHLADRVPTHPTARILQIAQDRSLEKQTIADFGLPVTPFVTIAHPASDAGLEQLRAAGERFGYPLILKTARSGYDGKGQRTVATAEDLPAAAEDYGQTRIVAEQRIAFSHEASILVARNPAGEVVTYPLVENLHRDHILAVSLCPSSLPEPIHHQAARIARTLAESLHFVGLLCVELFIDAAGQVMVNEIAPRPHNSGHLTIEAVATSQFEQHVRAVANLPLGATELRCPAAMHNLLGDLWKSGPPPLEKALAVPGVSLHLYGKASPRPKRKMGHLTAVGKDVETARARVEEAYARLKRP